MKNTDELDELIDKYYNKIEKELDTIAENFKFYRITGVINIFVPFLLMVCSFAFDAVYKESKEFIYAGMHFASYGAVGLLAACIILLILYPISLIAGHTSKKSFSAYDKLYFEKVIAPVIYVKYEMEIRYSKAENKEYFSEAGLSTIEYKITEKQKKFTIYIVRNYRRTRNYSIYLLKIGALTLIDWSSTEKHNPKIKNELKYGYGSTDKGSFFPITKRGKYTIRRLCLDIDMVLRNVDSSGGDLL